MKLVGDIGGTKVLLALVDEDGGFHHERRLASADFPDFTALLAAYLDGLDVAITGGCLAVAGPVADDGRAAKITNLPWALDAADLEARFALGRLTLINDFAGAALGVTTLKDDERVVLQAGEPLKDGVRLVVGAGTGLGMAILLPEGKHWRVLPSEGGHAGFAPVDELQARIWQSLQAEHGRVTWERVVSGPGLEAILRCLTGETTTAADIGARALAGEPMAHKAAEIFLTAYGAFAGDMALATLARGGVTLAGGIATKLLPLLRNGIFLEAFNAKAEHAALVRRMSLQVATCERLGLRGAACALRMSSPA